MRPQIFFTFFVIYTRKYLENDKLGYVLCNKRDCISYCKGYLHVL